MIFSKWVLPIVCFTKFSSAASAPIPPAELPNATTVGLPARLVALPNSTRTPVVGPFALQSATNANLVIPNKPPTDVENVLDSAYSHAPYKSSVHVMHATTASSTTLTIAKLEWAVSRTSWKTLNGWERKSRLASNSRLATNQKRLTVNSDHDYLFTLFLQI